MREITNEVRGRALTRISAAATGRLTVLASTFPPNIRGDGVVRGKAEHGAAKRVAERIRFRRNTQ